MALDADSLERLVPEQVSESDATGRDTLKLHLERYAFAARHVRGSRLLDLACGVGYGSRLLADSRPDLASVTGVDLSPEAIAYARERYATPRIEFVNGDAMTFTLPAPVDTLVSLETIEHLPDPHGFVRHATASLLAPGGHFVASVPTTPSVDANPHHLHDFTEASFRRMFQSLGYVEVAAFRQVHPFNPVTIARGRERRLKDMRENLPGYYLTHPDKALLRLWSTLKDGFNNKYITVVWRRAA